MARKCVGEECLEKLINLPRADQGGGEWFRPTKCMLEALLKRRIG